eukprot:1150117-Pelagomonas_calceolata.AAC.10
MASPMAGVPASNRAGGRAKVEWSKNTSWAGTKVEGSEHSYMLDCELQRARCFESEQQSKSMAQGKPCWSFQCMKPAK